MQHENRNPINLNPQHLDALTPSADLMSIAMDPDIHSRSWMNLHLRGDPSQLSSQTKWLGCRSFSSGNRISLWSDTATLPGWAHLRYISSNFQISTSNILQTFILLYPYCPYMSLPFLSFKHHFINCYPQIFDPPWCLQKGDFN